MRASLSESVRAIVKRTKKGQPFPAGLSWRERLLGHKGPEQAVRLVIGACGEQQRVSRTGCSAVSEGQAPQALNRQSLSRGPEHLAEKRASGNVISTDVAIAKIPHEQIAAEGAELGSIH